MLHKRAPNRTISKENYDAYIAKIQPILDDQRKLMINYNKVYKKADSLYDGFKSARTISNKMKKADKQINSLKSIISQTQTCINNANRFL